MTDVAATTSDEGRLSSPAAAPTTDSMVPFWSEAHAALKMESKAIGGATPDGSPAPAPAPASTPAPATSKCVGFSHEEHAPSAAAPEAVAAIGSRRLSVVEQAEADAAATKVQARMRGMLARSKSSFIQTPRRLKNASNLKVPSTVAVRTAAQIFVCMIIGMANMIGYARQEDTRTEDEWYAWPPHGLPPRASFQLITYVFLAEASVGMQASKLVLRIKGTVGGALIGYFILATCHYVSHATLRDILVSLLTASVMAGAQYFKSKRAKEAYMFVMFKLTLILVIIWGYDPKSLDTSFELPYWRILQVIIGCIVMACAARCVMPNYDRRSLRKNVPKLARDLAAFYRAFATCYIVPAGKKLELGDVLKLQIAINGLNAVAARVVWEWHPLIEPRSRCHAVAAAWKGVIGSLSHCAAILQALRLPFDDPDWAAPELLLENEDMKEHVKQLSQGFDAAVEVLALMLNSLDVDPWQPFRAQRRTCTPEEYAMHTAQFHAHIDKTLEETEALRKKVLAYMDDVALTIDDIKGMMDKVRSTVSGSKGLESLDADGDGGFDVHDLGNLLDNMLAEQRVTSASGGLSYVKTALTFLSGSRQLNLALVKAGKHLKALGPPSAVDKVHPTVV